MNWKRLLSSPPPTAAWAICGDLLALAVRARKGDLRGGVRALATRPFSTGPAGLQSVDRVALVPELAALGDALGTDRRPAVILPTSWFRSHLLELEGLPRGQTEMEDVIRWRLKKLLPVSTTDMRLSVVRVGKDGSKQRVLTLMMLERAASELETAFMEAGTTPGILTGRLFALRDGDDGWRVMVEAGPESLSLLVTHDGAPRVLRTKAVPSGRSLSRVAPGEFRLLEAFLRDTFGLDQGEEVSVTVECDDEEERWAVEEALDEFSLLRLERTSSSEVPGAAIGAATARALLSMLGEAR